MANGHMMQLNPSLPVEVVENDLGIPTGKGRAVALLDYGPEENLLWVVFFDDTRQCWQVQNPLIRAQGNPSIGRP